MIGFTGAPDTMDQAWRSWARDQQTVRKSARNLLIGTGAAAAIVVVCLVALSGRGTDPQDVLKALAEGTPAGHVVVQYPLDETLFPPDISAPCFRWKDDDFRSDLWLVTIELPDGQRRVNCFAEQSQWRPEASVWQDIKSRSVDKAAVVTIAGIDRKMPSKVLSAGRVIIRTSSDKVGSPLFYREVNLPFADAVRDPSAIRWRFGTISSEQPPPIILENLPVCGNCHSFSADGSILGMDIDYANDKGSYAIAAVRESMTLDKSAIITWSDYKRGEGEPTFGLLSQVSPDGRFVVSTVKDESVFVPRPNLDFSQLFFPVKGILCVYDRQTGVFQSLPGADAPNLVQSNPAWSPDGKHIVFAATQAHSLKLGSGPRKVLLSPEDCREFLEEGKPFKFDLYQIPFNEGKGGKAEPLAGASFNGKSNFFPRYSPDGKWIVFCKAENYMLLQPDSELYIIPAAGGEARRLRANTARMNSWHSFSANSRWLVFSGKPDSPYTRLYLTHIDERGESTPPVVLDRLTAPDRAGNIPEFVNVAPSAIRHIREQFIDDVSYVRGAWEYLKSNDYEGAERQARKALELNPKNADALYYLGLALFGRRQYDEAIRHLSEAAKMKPDGSEIQAELGVVFIAKDQLNEAIRHLQRSLEIAPDNAEAYFNLGVAMFRRGNKQEAMKCWSRAVELKPDDYETHYNLAMVLEEQKDLDKAIEHYRRTVQLKPDHSMAQAHLGLALCAKGMLKEAVPCLSRAVELDPRNTTIRYNLAVTLARLKQHDQAIAHLLQILRLEPRNVDASLCLAMSYTETGQTDKALNSLEEALNIAKSAGNENLVRQIVRRIELCRQTKPTDRSGSP
jgi:tetratricopeptide (TPR) repeat protein